MSVGADEREVGGNVDVALVGEGGEVDDAHSAVVAVALHGWVAAAVGDIEFAACDGQFVGLVAHGYFAHHLERDGVHLIDTTDDRFLVDFAYV